MAPAASCARIAAACGFGVAVVAGRAVGAAVGTPGAGVAPGTAAKGCVGMPLGSAAVGGAVTGPTGRGPVGAAGEAERPPSCLGLANTSARQLVDDGHAHFQFHRYCNPQ